MTSFMMSQWDWRGHLKARLHYIWDLGPSIRVRARKQSKQVNWCIVFTLIGVRVRDFCLVRPCTSSSLHVAISSDAGVRVRPRLCNAHTQSRLFMWSLLQATKVAMALDELGCSVKKTLPGARTRTRARVLGQCKCKCALNGPWNSPKYGVTMFVEKL